MTRNSVSNALLQTGFCLVWMTSGVLMLSNFAASLAQGLTTVDALPFNGRAIVYAVVAGVAVTVHAYLVDKKKGEKHD